MKAIHPRAIGYWYQPNDLTGLGPRLPEPSFLVLPGWIEPQQKQQLLRYLRSAPLFEVYRGYSWCRFHCSASDCEMGNREFWDGDWVWPEGLAHYIENHDVKLPDAFVRDAVSRTPPSSRAPPSILEVDFDFWMTWVAAESLKPPSTPRR